MIEETGAEPGFHTEDNPPYWVMYTCAISEDLKIQTRSIYSDVKSFHPTDLQITVSGKLVYDGKFSD